MVIVRLLGYLWSSPLTLLGLVVALLGGPKGVRWADGALEVEVAFILLGFGDTTGQTWGWLVLAKKADAATMRHERVHVGQALALGLLFIPAYFGHVAWLLVFT